MGDDAAIAEAKDDAKAANAKAASAPLQLMTQFLRTVSENRMEDALALAQTILKYEPHNAIILDYQGTLAQYINNEREIAAARDEEEAEEEEEEDSTGGSSTDTESAVSDTSTEGVSGEDEPRCKRNGPVPDESKNNEACGNRESHHVNHEEEEELQRLGGQFRELRERRAAASEESACRWDEHKFAASRREIEAALWDFLPDGAKQAAEKRAEEGDGDAPPTDVSK